MQKIKFVSFDYSLTSPAMCLSDGDKFYVCAQSAEKKISPFKDDKFEVQVFPYPQWGTSQQNRYFKLADGFINTMNAFKVDHTSMFGIEDYAFAAKGKVFHIAENTQMIKYLVWQGFQSSELLAIPPSAVKKVFTGKGNANKEKMAEGFKEHFGFYLHEKMGAKMDGTACDLVDSIAVNMVLQKVAAGELSLDEVFKKQNAKNFGELKKLGPFKGVAKAKA